METGKSRMFTILAIASALGIAPNYRETSELIRKGSTPNRYKPHQGKREMARRVKQMKRGRV